MWIFAVAGVVVLLVFAEAWRQRRKYGPPSGRPDLTGAGFLELQRQLQPDRRVDVIEAQLKGQDVADAEQDPAGDDKRPRGKGPTSGGAGHPPGFRER